MKKSFQAAGFGNAVGGLRPIEMTNRKRVLAKVSTKLPYNRKGVYQITHPVQLDASTVGLFVNIRADRSDAPDFEMGTDFCITRDPDFRHLEGFVPVIRNEGNKHPVSGKNFLMVAYPAFPAFVPLGVLLPDGTPHPYAGTGFCLTVRLGRPCDADGSSGAGYTNPLKDEVLNDVLISQLSWDGKELTITGSERKIFAEFAGELSFAGTPFAGIVPVGVDLLIGGIHALPGEKLGRAGVSRWQNENGKWKEKSFTPVGAPGSYEPSLIRDTDGSLLFTLRTAAGEWYPALQTSAEGMADSANIRDLRVWRSEDEGKHWSLCIQKKNVCNGCPVSITRTLDGTPVLLTNRRADLTATGKAMFHGSIREQLVAWPLNALRNDVLPEILLRNAVTEFGTGFYDGGWYMDHPIGEVVRLGDHQWHSIVCHRNMEIAEGGAGKAMTPFTGAYIEELRGGEIIREPWLFSSPQL